MNDDFLKPCPCCGSEAKVFNIKEKKHVACLNNKCAIRTKARDTEQSVMDRWNTRPAQPAGGVGLWSGIKSLDDLRGKAARSGSGCIVVSINDLNKIRDELSYLTPSPAPVPAGVVEEIMAMKKPREELPDTMPIPVKYQSLIQVLCNDSGRLGFNAGIDKALQAITRGV